MWVYTDGGNGIRDLISDMSQKILFHTFTKVYFSNAFFFVKDDPDYMTLCITFVTSINDSVKCSLLLFPAKTFASMS